VDNKHADPVVLITLFVIDVAEFADIIIANVDLDVF